MNSHQAKKLDVDALKTFRDRFALPMSDEDVMAVKFYRPPEDSAELAYLKQRRADLGGYLPSRCSAAPRVPVPELRKRR